MIWRALGLTQAEFGARYHLPLVHLINCEHGRDVPDEIAGAYLFVIASDPATVDRAFEQSQ
jgi:putative transcriptional regulator